MATLNGKPTIAVRLFQLQDADEIVQLFYDTVRTVNRRDYSQAQVQAWAPDGFHDWNWQTRTNNRFIFVAQGEEKILGFAELEFDGHIDCFYCHKDYQRQGIGSQLYQALENQALSLGLQHMFAEVSITAQSFFQSQGFEVIQAQTVTCRGCTFLNYAMAKSLF